MSEYGECESCDYGYKIPYKREMIKYVIFGVNTLDHLKEAVRTIFENEVTYQNVILDFEKWELKTQNIDNKFVK